MSAERREKRGLQMTRKALGHTFIYNLMITVLIVGVLSFLSPQPLWSNFLYGFVFANCIGFSIHSGFHLLDGWLQKLRPRVRGTMTGVICLLGGLIGSELGMGVLFLVFDLSWGAKAHLFQLVFNLFLALVFGIGGYLYFSTREKWQQAAVAVREKEIRHAELERLRAQAELKALQAKINPHFLFNTLNSIAGLISEDSEAAEQVTEKLAGLFRYSLQSAERERVPLGEELGAVRAYLEIEAVRLGDRLRFHLVVEEGLEEVEIPGLSVQPLVENAVRHGIAPKMEGGRIEIQVRRSGRDCVITVRDDGVGMAPGQADSGYALGNVRARLDALYNGASSLHLDSSQQGTRVEIRVPLSADAGSAGGSL